MEHLLQVDVHAHYSINGNCPAYRLYVNGEMLAERTFGWPPYQIYLTEHMYCNLHTGVHTLRLENLDSEGKFELDNFFVNKNQVNKNLLKVNENKIEWRFIVDLLNTNGNKNIVAIKLDQVSKPTPLAPPQVRPQIQIQQKKYDTNLALVQKMRTLNNRGIKK